jgi:hypothetical protein
MPPVRIKVLPGGAVRQAPDGNKDDETGKLRAHPVSLDLNGGAGRPLLHLGERSRPCTSALRLRELESSGGPLRGSANSLVLRETRVSTTKYAEGSIQPRTESLPCAVGRSS